MALSPEERTERARMGAHALHSQGKTNTRPAREAYAKRFLDEVDPDRELPEEERFRRAKHAESAYMSRLRLNALRPKREEDETDGGPPSEAH